MIVISSALSGITGTFNDNETSRLVQEVLPGFVLNIWYAGLFVGSVGILYGLFRYNYSIASMCYFLIGPIAIAYAVIIMVEGETPLAYSPIITIAFGLAGILRGLQLFSLLKQAEREVE